MQAEMESYEKDAILLSNKQFEDLEILYRIKNHSMNLQPFEMEELLQETQSLFRNISEQKLIFARNPFAVNQIVNRIDSFPDGFSDNIAHLPFSDVVLRPKALLFQQLALVVG